MSMRRILVVDDEPSIGKALTLGLSSEEIKVEVAENGNTGVQLGTRKHYDVLIADLCLPDLDGLEVIQRVRAHSPDIVSIIITGNPGRGTGSKALSQEMGLYLEKPLEMKTVKDAIRRGLEERELKRLKPLKEFNGAGPLALSTRP